jgi:hypothetical protein
MKGRVMAIELKVGERLGSVVCDTEVIVVRAQSSRVELTCGGEPMAPVPASRVGSADESNLGTLLGKRYQDTNSGLELLCTKAGQGTLRVDGVPMGVKAAKNLPSSD